MALKHRSHSRLPLRGLALVGLLSGLAAACGPRNGTDDVTPSQGRDTAAAVDSVRTDTARTDTARTDTSRTR
jgi:hypothetical protein